MTAPLLLVDGHHLLHRAWHGFPSRITSRDGDTDQSAVVGVVGRATATQAGRRR